MPGPLPDEADPVPAPPRARRSGRQRTVLGALAVLFVLLVGALTLAGYALVEWGRVDRYKDLEVDAAPAGEPENYLVVGSDTREGSGGEGAEVTGRRSDTIMIVRIDPREEAATVLSLPRDLTVPIAGSGEVARINSAYAQGTPEQGRQTLIDTIRDNVGIDINHYVEIDFQGFARMVDAVGGVPLFFEAAVRDKNSGLYQPNLGCVTLMGDQALPFVRSRHLQYMTPEGEWESDPTADLGRITRQQVFMREALSRVVDDASDPLRLRELVDIGVETVGIDGEMGIRDILDLADRFRDFDPDELKTYPLPIVENDDGETVSIDEAAAEPILALFRSPQDAGGSSDGSGGPDATLPAVPPDAVHVQVLNGSGVSGQASQVADALGGAGFDVTGTGNAPQPIPWPETTVLYRAGDEQYAQRLARQVTGGVAYQESAEVDAGNVALVTGSNFTAISTSAASVDTVGVPGESAAANPTTTAGEGGGEGPTGDESTAAGAAPAPVPAPPPTIGYSVGEPPPGVDCG